MIIDKKCTCGSKSTGNTTIRCCNLCGLPLPNESWHFNLDENIFSRVEKPVKPANGVIDDMIKECKVAESKFYFEGNKDAELQHWNRRKALEELKSRLLV